MARFIAELKRRKVFRVAVVYVATAFVILQAVDLILPRLGVPDWAMSLIVILTLIGFPIALVLAWALELTPDGVRRTAPREAPEIAESSPSLLGKRTIAVTVLLVVLGIGIGAGWFLKPGAPGPAEPLALDTEAAGATTTSIAVLAFDNMSPDPDNAFFAEGISEEILNILAAIPGLRVTSRTSAFSFSGRGTPIPEIARQLNVAHVLEGSVRRVGDELRITAQLIDAVDDIHLWSEVYSRQMGDIFAMQEDIAQAVADALGDALGIQRVNVDAPSRDLAAYELFLRGRQLFHQRADLQIAYEDLKAAVERDPEFAEAWVYLAATCQVMMGYAGVSLSFEETLTCRQESADRALALHPDHPLALSIIGDLQQRAGDQLGALETRQRAALLAQHDATPILWYGIDLLHLGYIEEAIALLEQSYRSDPLSSVKNGWLAIAYMAGGRHALAEPRMEFADQNGWPIAALIDLNNLGAAGQREQVVERVSARLESVEPETLEPLIEAIHDPSQLPRLMAGLTEESELMAVALGAESLLLFGAVDLFFEFLGMALSNPNEGAPAMFNTYWFRSVWQPPMGAVRDDPRLYQLAEELGVVEVWEQRGFPPGCRRANEEQPRLDCSNWPFSG